MMNFSLYLTKLKSKIIYGLRLDRRLRNWDDEPYLKLRYWLRMGTRLDLSAPEKFSEKLQWLKLNDRNPEYTRMVDKFEVKEWVTERIGDEFVVPTLGVWEEFDDINFAQLPEQFVLKCTHDSGGLVICDDRDEFDVAAAKLKIEKSLARNYYYVGREWPYKNVKPRILAEVFIPSWSPGIELMHNDQKLEKSKLGDGIIDYKFYCFGGKPEFLYVSKGLHDHGTAQMDFLTLNWKLAEFRRPDYRRLDKIPPKPENFDLMVEKARQLAQGIPFVRVDFFEHEGQVLFSEMTFSPVSGFMPITPKSADIQLGKMINITT